MSYNPAAFLSFSEPLSSHSGLIVNNAIWENESLIANGNYSEMTFKEC